ncbi:MAG: hypothetical protein AAF633_14950 [Chloroflexota bacterium]
MNIQFFDESDHTPRMREDVRLLRTRLEVAPEGKRVAIDFELTPFIERPTIELRLFDDEQRPAGLLKIIETLDTFNRVVMHLRDSQTTSHYTFNIRVYFANIDEDMQRMDVDEQSQRFEWSPGNVVNWENQGN